MARSPTRPPADQGTVLVADANRLTRPHDRRAALPGTDTAWLRPQRSSRLLLPRVNGVEAILLDTSLDGMNGWEILPCCAGMATRIGALPSFF